MCHYFISLYGCGHERLEVIECAIVSRTQPVRHCQKPTICDVVVQPSGCLHAFMVGYSYARTRRLPMKHRDKFEAYDIMNSIWGQDMSESMGEIHRREILLQRKASLSQAKKETFCIMPVPSTCRHTEDPYHLLIRKLEMEDQEGDEVDTWVGDFTGHNGKFRHVETIAIQTENAKDANVRAKMRMPQTSNAALSRKRGASDDEVDEDVGGARKRTRRTEGTTQDEDRLTPVSTNE